MAIDPRIGKLSSGKYYCFPKGHGGPEFIGTLEEVEAALGIQREAPAVPCRSAIQVRFWTVTLTFQYPAWDESAGIVYRDIFAGGKAEANAIARRRATLDGHLGGGKGRVKFTAQSQ